MRTKRTDPTASDDLVTLWHVGGVKPCYGPAVKVPPDFLESDEPLLAQACELPDGSKMKAGDPLACGTCGTRLSADLASELALSRERYRT
jgi:hypothetical protein